MASKCQFWTATGQRQEAHHRYLDPMKPPPAHLT